jgi:hypothetical protein
MAGREEKQSVAERQQKVAERQGRSEGTHKERGRPGPCAVRVVWGTGSAVGGN